jgi:hypothetical protein
VRIRTATLGYHRDAVMMGLDPEHPLTRAQLRARCRAAGQQRLHAPFDEQNAAVRIVNADCVARLFSLPGMNFLGQLSFSIFIWQNLFLMLGFAVLSAAPESTSLSFWFAVIGLLVMSVISAHFIEKPLARKLRKRGPARDNLSPATVT